MPLIGCHADTNAMIDWCNILTWRRPITTTTKMISLPSLVGTRSLHHLDIQPPSIHFAADISVRSPQSIHVAAAIIGRSQANHA